MSVSGRACRFKVRRSMILLLLGLLAAAPCGDAAAAPSSPPPAASAADNAARLRLTADEIVAESPAASQKLLGAYSEVPDFPEGGKSVKLFVFRGTDLVCIAPIKSSRKDKMTCWHWVDVPPPLQKQVNEKDREFAEN